MTTSAQESFMAAIEHMEEGVALFDSDDRLVICNGRYLSAFMPELQGEYVPGMSFEEIVTIAAERGFFAREGRTVEEVAKERMDLRHNPKQPCEMRLANGDWISYREHRTSEGGTVVLRLNITERKRTEESLVQSEERYRSVAETANDAIISIDGRGRIVSWNRGAEQISGYARSELLGNRLEKTHARRVLRPARRGRGTREPRRPSQVRRQAGRAQGFAKGR